MAIGLLTTDNSPPIRYNYADHDVHPTRPREQAADPCFPVHSNPGNPAVILRRVFCRADGQKSADRHDHAQLYRHLYSYHNSK